MKKFKKLIPALCMLLVSAVMLGSSTYAWFSMNNKVTATGMSVTAVANTQFLVIAKNQASIGTLTEYTMEKDGNYGISENGARTNNVYPVAYNNTGAALSLNVKASDTTTTTHTVADKGWYTAFSPEYSNATGTIGGTTDVVTNVKDLYENPSEGQTGLNDYVLKYECVIGLAAGSADASGKISIQATFKNLSNDDNNAITALVIIGTERIVVNNKDENSRKGETANEIALTSSTVANVTVYLFVDGTAANVKSQDYAQIAGSLELEFTMEGIA